MTHDQARAHVGEGSYRLTYNLFRRRGKPDLHCAVPQDRPVPSFLDATLWDFAGSFGEGGAAPLRVRACCCIDRDARDWISPLPGLEERRGP